MNGPTAATGGFPYPHRTMAEVEREIDDRLRLLWQQFRRADVVGRAVGMTPAQVRHRIKWMTGQAGARPA